ncbi:MAG: histone deacetylase family protein [Proteobacteria bacterium]|nr:histone deacetylase family protein [Pseudomonadota bacterium]MBI3497247.1 histone deacetylase family protein [Pseudomonadota bacterium]
MTTRLYTHPACIEHNPGRMHPERPARLQAILAALDAPPFARLARREAPLGTVEQIARNHPEPFVRAALAAVPKSGLVDLGDEVLLSPGSGEAALRAVGAVCAAIDAVIAGEASNAFCAVRPPGHHAEPLGPMGFCLFNNVAIGAQHARAVHGLERVAVVDFDVHHGNGTQAAFERDPNLFYASTHEWPLYPGTGAASERGVGNIWNAPLAPGSGSQEFRAAFSERILPALQAFGPELILISAGFDAHADDPLASLRLREEDYAWVTHELCRLAAATASGRVVSALEGGYDLEALAASTAAHVEALMAH